MPSAANRPPSAYHRQVFINCPFDDAYWPLFQAMVFAIRACGFRPRCSLESEDAGEERLAKIIRIIGECRFGIHDLSRKGAGDSGMARFNMPFEMGLFLGAAKYGVRKKALLVMEAKRFDYHRFISDISGRDIRHHGDEPARVIGEVRDWLNAQNIVPPLPGGKDIAGAYRQFQRELPALLRHARLALAEIGPGGFLNWADLATRWLGLSTRGRD